MSHLFIPTSRTGKCYPLFTLLFFLSPCMALAMDVTLTMDEIPTQAIDGLSFSGVTFGFEVNGFNSLDARYNSMGPGLTMFVEDPSVEGDAAGVVTMWFDSPTPILQFGLALAAAEQAGFTVELFDNDLNSLGATYILGEIVQPVIFPEGQFVYAGAPVRQAVVSFDTPIANRFALDNLTFRVPEPASIPLLCLGLAAFAKFQRRKSRANDNYKYC